MKNHYVLPVCFAAAAHGALLFGFTKNPRPIKMESEKKILVPFEVRQVEEEPVVVENDGAASAPKAAPDAPELPRSAEPPPLVVNDQITIEVPRLSSVDARDIRQILNVPVGNPDGTGKNPWGDVIPHTLLDRSPGTRFQSSPFYPPEARRNGMSGTVIVEFLVDEKGQVVEPRIVSSSDRIFEESSLRAVAKWKFEPGRRDGRIVRFRMSAPIVFSLSE